MKQEAGKKSKKWIWLGIALVVLLVAGAVILAMFLTPAQQDNGGEADRAAAELYWNVDGDYYMSISDMEGFSGRTAAEDGNYYIRFAFGGQQKELQIVDKQLVNYIDSLDLMGLVFDSDGVVVDAVDPKTVATEIGKDFYVQKVDGSSITVNSSLAMNGMELEVELAENAGIYDVSPEAETVGALADCQLFDSVQVYAIEGEKATHVYITAHQEEAEVYWRVERMYDSVTGTTSRVPDENGVYTILFAKDGKQVELKCRDMSVVNTIDNTSAYYGEFGLIFDEKGYIVKTVDASIAMRGKNLCKDYHVTAIDGNTIELTRLADGTEKGRVITFTMNDTCKVYNCCAGCAASHVGEEVPQLQLLDRVNIHTDLEGNPLVAFITRRMVDEPMYFNLQQKYNWDTLETSRVPDASGYYVYDMIVEGKQVTVRTKDKAIATRVDSQFDCCMGFVLDGNIIKKVYDSKCIAGDWSLGGTNLYVTSLTGQILTLSASTNFTKTYNGIISPDCKIYDVTGFYGVEKGSTTTLQLYDRATCYKNPYGEVVYIFVTERYVEGTKMYYNTNRKYSTAEAATTREPDADGWYVFDMICEGKAVTVKTKSKSLASYMDMQSAPLMALKVGSDGVVRNAYPAISAQKFSKKTANYHYVDKISSDGTYTTYYYSGGERFEATVTQKLAKNCIVYNVSTCFENYRGEKTTLRKDDQIQAIATNPNGESTVIFVMNRSIDAPLYWNMKQMYNWTAKETTREPDADGWYVFDLAVNGTVKQFKTKDKAIATAVDANYSAFTLTLDGDIITKVYPATSAKNVNSPAGSRYDVMEINGGTVKLAYNQPGATGAGNTLELDLSKDCVVYDVSPYAKNPGGKAEIGLGDRVVCYIDGTKQIIYCYIVYKNTHSAGYISYCDHCGEEVFWNPYLGSVPAVDAHYYLTHDLDATYQISVGSSEAKTDVVLDLNGHTLTSLRRTFLVYGTLSVMDSAGGGRLLGKNIAGGNGACLMVADGGTLNLYSGRLSVTDDCVVPKSAGVLYVSSKASVNMYGGEISGGKASVSGGNVAILGGSFHMSGGKIAGDVAVEAGSSVTLSGSPVITMGSTTGMSLSNGVRLQLGELTKDTSVVVSASGIFTTEHKNIQQYADYFQPVSQAHKITVESSALCYTNPSALALDADGKAVCPVCNENVQWTPVSGSSWSSRIGDHKSGHYYLDGDVNLADYVNNFATAARGGKLCLHLNDRKLSYGSRTAIAYAGSTINIMGSGTVTLVPYTGTESNNAAALYVLDSGTINLYGGTYRTADTTRPVALIDHKDGAINVYDGAVIEGEAVVTNGTLVLSGNADVAKITVSETGKLAVKKDWTGTAVVDFATVDNGMIPAANGACEGAFTGQLSLEDGTVLTAENFQAGEDSGEEDKLELENGKAVCPVCGGEAVEWTAVSGSSWRSRIGDSKSGHYYLDGDVNLDTYVNNFATAVTNGTLCIHLNGNDLTYASRIAVVYSNSTINLMGSGTVTLMPYTGTETNNPAALYVNNNGTINLYGGTYMTSDATRPVALIDHADGAINVYDGAVIAGETVVTAGTLTLSGTAKADKLTVSESGKLAVKENWIGTAVADFAAAPVDGKLPEANGICESTFTGSLTTSDGRAITGENGRLLLSGSAEEPDTPDTPDVPENGYTGTLALDANSCAICPACNQNVQWTPVSGSKWDSRIGDSKSGHYYLDGDVNLPAYVNNFATAAKDSTLCIHLNGNDLTYGSRIAVSYDNSTLNIMGSGSVTAVPYTGTSGGNDAALVVSNAGTLNLYSGTYTTTDTTRPVILVKNSSAAVNIYDGVVINGAQGGIDSVVVNAGTVTLSGNSQVIGTAGELSGNISVSESAKLVVKADFTGTASVAFAGATDTIPEANGASEGAFTGKLYLETPGNPEIIGEDGRLVVTDILVDPYSGVLLLDEQSRAECPVCKQTVQWTPVSGSKWDSRIGNSVSGHYYLDGDVNLPAYVNNFATAAKDSTLCIHLNGNDLTYGSRIAVSYDNSTLNIMGSGSVTAIPYTGTSGGNDAALVVSHAGTLNLYSGTYSTTDTTRPVLLVNNASAVVNVLGSAKLVGVEGGVDTVQIKTGTVSLSENSCADMITVSQTGKLNVKADWVGSAVAAFEAEITDNKIPAANGVSEGAYSGELRLSSVDGPFIAGVDGGLVVKEPQDDGVLKILGIGNSFTWDSMHLLYDVYKAENPDQEVVLAYLYYGGCSLSTHVSNLTGNAGAYTYYKLDDDIYAKGGKWSVTNAVTMLSGIQDENWDIVTLQQNSGNSTNTSTYNGDIDTIRSYVVEKLGYTPEFAWNFTWGYPDDAELLNTSSSANFAQNFFNNHGTTEAMYNKISAAVQAKIVDNGFDYLMPVGTAVQNARSNHLTAKDLYRDYCHLNNLGRLIAAYTWYCEFEGYNGTDKALDDLKLTKIPTSLALSIGVTEVDEELETIIIESVNNAMKNKFAVTKP